MHSLLHTQGNGRKRLLEKDFIRVSTRILYFIRVSIRIFRAYSQQKSLFQAQFGYALPLEPTAQTHILFHIIEEFSPKVMMIHFPLDVYNNGDTSKKQTIFSCLRTKWRQVEPH